MAVLDFAYQKWQNLQDLKMSKQEVKEEFKQQEGDPKIKGKIRQKQRQMAMARMMQEVPQADVIVTNPTHFAVALKYDTQKADSPMINAKGQDLMAQRIKQIAKENDVPMVENMALARELYSKTEVGDIIPVEYYKVIATVYSKIGYLNKK
jgi:flagellar biosynthetic protein FlhB